jgi:hypothetical protein
VTDVGYEQAGEKRRPSETVAGYLASVSIFISLISLAWHPLRLIAPSIIVALIAAGMGGARNQRLTFAAVMIAAACFFFGMTIAVVTSRPLW